MSTNDIYSKIVKVIFKGNIGKQFQLLRQMREIDEFEKLGLTPNNTQQTHIDSVKNEYNYYDNQIRILLNETKLEDMK